MRPKPLPGRRYPSLEAGLAFSLRREDSDPHSDCSSCLGAMLARPRRPQRLEVSVARAPVTPNHEVRPACRASCSEYSDLLPVPPVLIFVRPLGLGDPAVRGLEDLFDLLGPKCPSGACTNLAADGLPETLEVGHALAEGGDLSADPGDLGAQAADLALQGAKDRGDQSRECDSHRDDGEDPVAQASRSGDSGSNSPGAGRGLPSRASGRLRSAYRIEP